MNEKDQIILKKWYSKEDWKKIREGQKDTEEAIKAAKQQAGGNPTAASRSRRGRS